MICADLSPVKPVPSGYEYALALVMSPLNIVNTPAIGVTPAPVTCGSAGIVNVSGVSGNTHPVTPKHGFAVPTVRL